MNEPIDIGEARKDAEYLRRFVDVPNEIPCEVALEDISRTLDKALDVVAAAKAKSSFVKATAAVPVKGLTVAEKVERADLRRKVEDRLSATLSKFSLPNTKEAEHES